MYRFELVANDHRKHPDADIQLPSRATKNACAYDFFAPEDITIQQGATTLIWTDVKARIPSRYALLLNVRSSFGKSLVSLANTQGWVDSDYVDNPSNDGNIGVMLHNGGNEPFVIRKGDRIAQGMIVRFYVTDDDEAHAKREGGLGSTGK